MAVDLYRQEWTCKKEFREVCRKLFGDGDVEFSWSDNVFYFKNENYVVPYGVRVQGIRCSGFWNGNFFVIDEDSVRYFYDSSRGKAWHVDFREKYQEIRYILRRRNPETFDELWDDISLGDPENNFYVLRDRGELTKVYLVTDSVKKMTSRLFEQYEKDRAQSLTILNELKKLYIAFGFFAHKYEYKYLPLDPINVRHLKQTLEHMQNLGDTLVADIVARILQNLEKVDPKRRFFDTEPHVKDLRRQFNNGRWLSFGAEVSEVKHGDRNDAKEPYGILTIGERRFVIKSDKVIVLKEVFDRVVL